MKNLHLYAAIILFALINVFSISLNAQAPMSTPVQNIRYEFVSYDGTNASAVVWWPTKHLYVTVIAGNTEFPMEGFNGSGENKFTTKTVQDVRGLWYNPGTNELEANAAGEFGWFRYAFGKEGNPASPEEIFAGQHQPDFQAVGTFYPKKKQVVFLNLANSEIQLYSRKNPSKIKRIPLAWGAVSPMNINLYSVGFTGQTGYEFVLLDYVNGQLVFFNLKGEQTALVKLPAGAPLNETFAFSFTNNHAFLYDKDARVWYGYQVF